MNGNKTRAVFVLVLLAIAAIFVISLTINILINLIKIAVAAGIIAAVVYVVYTSIKHYSDKPTRKLK